MSVSTNHVRITHQPPKSYPPGLEKALSRRRYAYALISRADTPPPRYGSAAWADLEDTDPRKIAAVVIAAECWAREEDTLEDDLRHEIGAARHALEEIQEEEWDEISSSASVVPLDHFRRRVLEDSLNEASADYWDHRAGLLEAALPQASDYTGSATPAALEERAAQVRATVAEWRARAAQLRDTEGVE